MNQNLQQAVTHDRLTALEGEISAANALLLALVRTHPDPAALRQAFGQYYEYTHTASLSSRTTDSAIDSLRSAGAVFDEALRQRLAK